MMSALSPRTGRSPGRQSPPSGAAPAEQRVTAEELSRLAELMRTLTDHTAQLEIAHRKLEARVAELDLELERKNEALQEKIEDLDRISAHLNRVLDSMSEGVVTLDPEGVITRANRAAGEICEVEPRTLAGRPIAELLTTEALAAVERARRGGSGLEGVEVELLGPDQNPPIPVRLSVVPLRGNGGAQPGTMLQFADLREVRALEERARHSDRLRALGELTAGVAHEMRNPLTTIRGYVQLLPEEGNDPAFVAEMTGLVLSEIDRLARLTDNLLNLARPTSATLERLDLVAWLQEIAAFEQERLARIGVRLETSMPEEPVPASIDPARMRQVVLNLVQNGAEAMPEGGMVRLLVRTEGNEDRRWAVLEVQDTGAGIPEEDLDRVFNPFFTTKQSGSGLGLALSHRIVEEHLGHFRVDSRVGDGTRLEVWLPLIPERQGRAPADGGGCAAEAPPNTDGTIEQR